MFIEGQFYYCKHIIHSLHCFYDCLCAQGFYVFRLVNNLPAAKCGKISIGDKILSVRREGGREGRRGIILI